MTNEKPEQPVFIVDSSVMKDILNGKNEKSSSEFFEKVKEMKKLDSRMQLYTPISSFLRAIHLAEKDVPMQKLQELLAEVKLLPSMFADYTDEKAVKEDLMTVAKVISGDLQESNISGDKK